jgi:hypothetical protein
MDRYTLGDIKPLQGSVLYLALEDGDRRLRSRIDKLLPHDIPEWPDTLRLVTEWRRVDQGGLDDIRKWVADERAAGRRIAFVAVDVLKLVRPANVKGKPAYEADTRRLPVCKSSPVTSRSRSWSSTIPARQKATISSIRLAAPSG